MLKEGFAMYFADVGMNMVYPEWNIVSIFIFQFFILRHILDFILHLICRKINT